MTVGVEETIVSVESV